MVFRGMKTNKKGLTLLEVLVATFVLVIVSLPLLNMFVYNTTLVKKAEDMGDTTYLAQSVMEDLQPMGYGALYGLSPTPGAKGSYQIKSVINSSTVYVTKQVSIDRIPYGSFNSLVSGAACYAHLIVSGSTGTFVCPDGKLYTGAISSAVTITSSNVTLGGSSHPLNKPSGANLILIINAGTSSIPSLTINLPSDKSVPYVLYALSPDDTIAQTFTITNGSSSSREYRKYTSAGDPTPAYMLVNAVVKVYKPDGTTVDSLFQNTMKVNLP